MACWPANVADAYGLPPNDPACMQASKLKQAIRDNML